MTQDYGLPPVPPSPANAYWRQIQLRAAQGYLATAPIGPATPTLEPVPLERLDPIIEEAIEHTLPRIMKQTWDQMYPQMVGKLTDAEFWQIWSAADEEGAIIVQDPFTGEDMIDPETGKVVLGDFGKTFDDICGYQFEKDTRRYANLKAAREREEAKIDMLLEESRIELAAA